ncbi:MAG: hypothetical protein KA313_00655 [Pseudarcicella sp.]|jgi:hypothetical protein|nr:hypothetical protein [Pseudarcicella sp.]MBP6409589.1 hypothetical protein [Pseudarcicella sp.]
MATTAKSKCIDKLKSNCLYLINKPVNDNGKVENPFLDATKVYSNIEGGLGFWGAIQTKKIKIEK